MNGREVFKFAVKAVPQTVAASLEEAGLLTDDIDWLVLHQVGYFSGVCAWKESFRALLHGDTSAVILAVPTDGIHSLAGASPGKILAC
jgi:hypothetical protein